MTPKAAPAITMGPMASPSRPSVRFTALDAPMITSIAKRNHIAPRCRSQPLKKGIASTGCQTSAGCQ